jgi:phenylacetate-coenzyme A ligase PaaK-like adenylate-forming protein
MTRRCSSHGKKGRIVITSLFNKAHPFIRYDIGDIGILDEKHFTKTHFAAINRTNK